MADIKHMLKKNLPSVVLNFILIACLFSCGCNSGFKTYSMWGSSMEPTLKKGTMITTVPVLGDLQRGDIVVYAGPNNSIVLVHRIVGLPGETIEINNNKLYINGIVQIEPYVTEPTQYSLKALKIPDSYYFVLGDNRNHSSDSHSFGPIPKTSISGIIK